jgi:hypothetical protein
MERIRDINTFDSRVAAERNSLLNACHQAAAFVAGFEMSLESLESRREDHAVKITFDQPVKISATEHLSGCGGGEDAIFKRGGFAEDIFGAHLTERLDGHSDIAEQFAARAATQPVRSEFCPRAGLKLTIKVIADRLLEFNAIHHKSVLSDQLLRRKTSVSGNGRLTTKT